MKIVIFYFYNKKQSYNFFNILHLNFILFILFHNNIYNIYFLFIVLNRSINKKYNSNNI